ncbi:hypothetical protein [Persicobacter sp. CCB-QB2]|uniref:hypothetical protein n=1 Tax=Persicobacter sp. CCB-QB2 TaxID=1561025 RepID=UPI0006A9E089|nr:hypothetical protein [Persicobacter sp. CCB-QB2]
MEMIKDEKRAFFLLMCLMLHYHGLDEHEQNIINHEASQHAEGENLKEWALEFIKSDYLNIFERAKKELNHIPLQPSTRLNHLLKVWDLLHIKGYITEMEATAMIRIAAEWELQEKLIQQVRP